MGHSRLPRPRIVTLLVLAVLTFAASQLLRLGASLVLPPLPLSVPAWYLPLTGAVWAGCGLTAAYGLLTRRVWALGFVGWAGLLYGIWLVADRLLLTRSAYAARTVPATLVIWLAVLALLGWSIRRPAVRSYFEESVS
jgi:hypothetical protein